MDRCESVGRRVLSRKFPAILLAAFMLTGLLSGAGYCGGSSPADEALREEIRIATEALLFASKGIMQESARMELYNTLLLFDDAIHNYFIDITYKIDHKELGDKVFNDQASSLSSLYDALKGDGELTFESSSPQRSAFDSKNPGYRGSEGGSPVIFSDKYRERTNDMMNFAYGSIKSNNSEARGFLQDSHPLSPANVKKLHDASVKAGNPITAQGGYRQVMQAGNQAVNFTNQEVTRLRVDLMRLGESRLKIAMNERQEEMDVHAAFDQAVRTWKPSGSGRSY